MEVQEKVERGGTECRRQASMLAAHIASLREPYRQNAIQWLESCTAREITNVDLDLAEFFGGLRPEVRRAYVSNLQLLLTDAVKHFGMIG